VTVQTLLDMQSGVGVSDNYPTGPAGWGVAIAQMYATTDIDWFMKNNRKMAFEPGSKSEYRSVDTMMIGMIIKAITGERVADYFSENVWKPIGAKYPATWNVDRVGGTEKTFCCFNATARDYARVGLAVINGGQAGAKQIIDPAWLKRMTTSVTKLIQLGIRCICLASLPRHKPSRRVAWAIYFYESKNPNSDCETFG
jgi:CubicO group peptidase (beta-lactamase class C family)